MKLVRCAIYTRKSSEEGLDQAFNSLHAQREACEAYVKSQAHEGWRALATAYDDGGFSGGTIERPALKQLLADVDAGRVDTIVVYKIDRLTRSLADFARIVERLEARGASFVSVTQAFNTTTSMGRLTLNVLLSFAQFEREVTGERIRDKILASKKKGMWMGGVLPLGYDAPTDPKTRALVVNGAEAEIVRMIFETYLATDSVAALAERLAAAGIRSKLSRSPSGKERGGQPFSRGALYHLLQNRTYVGEIPHGRDTYPGTHPPIVSQSLFDAVQAKLASQRRARRDRPLRSAEMPLKGLLFDADRNLMSPSFGYGRGGKVYRYYVSGPLQRGQRARRGDPALRRISASPLEARLQGELCRLMDQGTDTPLSALLARVRRIEIERAEIRVVFCSAQLPRNVRQQCTPVAGEPELVELALPVTCEVRGGRTRVIAPEGQAAFARRDPVLIRGLRQAHRIAAGLGWRMTDGAITDLRAKAPEGMYERRLCRLAFLAPEIQKSILEGRHPAGLTLDALLRTEIPLDWSMQREKLGFRRSFTGATALCDPCPGV